MFDDVIGQETARKILTNQIEKSRIPGAYLFHGQFGVGKRQTALSFAKTVNCKKRCGCGKCAACGKIERCVHPDVQIVFPVPSTLKPDELMELFQRGRECNFRFVFPQRASISIDAVRAISHEMFFKPHEGTLKVIIIIDADKMTIQASNALLKTLEEPPPYAVFILITERPHYLPPTILSRCQVIRFRSLSQQEISAALEERGVETASALLVSRLSAGSLGRALLFSNPEYLETRKKLVQGFLALHEKKWQPILDFSQWLVDKCDKQIFAAAFISLYRDLLILKEGKEELLHNYDYLPDLRNRAHARKLEEILESLNRLDDLVTTFEKSINLKVAFPPLLYALA